jgi:glycosyltransferase involved in cell wall biosynthesis
MEIYFSVIIPSFNEASQVRECIESVMGNKGEGIEYEIIIVDNDSTDGTQDIAKELKVKVVENTEGERKSIAALRNVGAGAAAGSVLVFLDADMVVPNNWLASAKEFFNKGYEGAMGFVERAPSSAGWVGKTWGERLYLKHTEVTNVDFLAGRNIFINRHVFESICGFDEKFKTNEDKDLILRVLDAGYKAILVPRPIVTHLGCERNLMEFLKKEFWRQGSTYEFTKSRGYSFRTLRNPALSLWHISGLFFTVLSVFTFGTSTVAYLMFLWLLPSLLLTCRERAYNNGARFFLRLFLLTLLRWHVSGLALIIQIAKGMPWEKVDTG